MGDETASRDSEKRHRTVFGIVRPALEAQERRAREPAAEPRTQRSPELFAHHGDDQLGHRFGGLQQDVAHESIADHDVRLAVEDVAPFDVADEIETGRLEGTKDLARQTGALGLFLADRQEADPGRGDADDLLGIEVPHDGELAQVLGP